MKKRILSIVMALVLIASLGVVAFADTVDDNPVDTTVDEVKSGDTMNTNDGTVTKNNGTVNTNNGSITTNNGEVGTNTSDASISKNDGIVTTNEGYVGENKKESTVETNDGLVETNNGTITDNENGVETNNAIITTNGEKGTVKQNSGSILTNKGNIEKNITTEDGGEYAFVYTNEGTVTTNEGVVYDNKGTVETNTITGQVTNSGNGKVINNYGTIVVDEDNAIFGVQAVDDTKEVESVLKSVNSGVKVKLEELFDTFTKASKELRGFTDQDGKSYDLGAEYSINKPLKLTAVWVDPDPGKGDDDEPVADSGSYSGYTTTTETVPTFKAEVKAADDGCAVTLKGVKASGMSISMNGTTVDASSYTVSTDANGVVVVTFTPEFLATLSAGTHTFAIIVNGSTVAYITITID